MGSLLKAVDEARNKPKHHHSGRLKDFLWRTSNPLFDLSFSICAKSKAHSSMQRVTLGLIGKSFGGLSCKLALLASFTINGPRREFNG